jgi:hypothetical protein
MERKTTRKPHMWQCKCGAQTLLFFQHPKLIYKTSIASGPFAGHPTFALLVADKTIVDDIPSATQATEACTLDAPPYRTRYAAWSIAITDHEVL